MNYLHISTATVTAGTELLLLHYFLCPQGKWRKELLKVCALEIIMRTFFNHRATFDSLFYLDDDNFNVLFFYENISNMI